MVFKNKIIKEYIKYLKDNPKGYWFRRKLYGWGWTPATRDGWFTMLIFVVLVSLNAWRIDLQASSPRDLLINFIPQTFFLVLILLFVCYKTGEKPRWQWGPSKKNK